MGERDGFTPEEWRTLQFAPFWMFSAVVGAYRDFDPPEYAAFRRCVETAAAASGRLAHDVLASVATDLPRLTQEYGTDRRSIASGLCAVAALLAKVPRDESDTFHEVMVSEIGAGVARARGRFGRVMSEEDEKNLGVAAELLA